MHENDMNSTVNPGSAGSREYARSEHGTVNRELSYTDRQSFQAAHGIGGNSVQMREIVDTVMQVAPTGITVLITGESGTGKEIIAKAIHNASRRSRRRLVTVNCGAIPEGILESELFGHEKGAFTGAVEARKGYFELADGGTIFLDEIGETPISTQVKLLRVLENGEFMRVGSAETQKVDVRVIAATNTNLEEEVRTRRFRQDLFFRLRSVNIRIPSLRDRRGDISLLFQVFLRDSDADENAIMLTDNATEALLRYGWPGNVRELKNLVDSLTILERGKVVDENVVRKYLQFDDPVIDARPLPVPLGMSSEQAERELIFRALMEIRGDLVGLRKQMEHNQYSAPIPLPVRTESSGTEMVSLDDHSLDEMEQMMILRALRRFDGNRRLAAQALDISERTLYRKIKEYEL